MYPELIKHVDTEYLLNNIKIMQLEKTKRYACHLPPCFETSAAQPTEET